FQAEDGIRDRNVTGVQTCALPILGDADLLESPGKRIAYRRIAVGKVEIGQSELIVGQVPDKKVAFLIGVVGAVACQIRRAAFLKIGRASCREGVEVAEVDGVLKEK